jgi:hypothetical protein
MGRGKIIGELECLEETSHQVTMTCMSQKAFAYQIKKEDLRKLKLSQGDDLFKEFMEMSHKNSQDIAQNFS